MRATKYVTTTVLGIGRPGCPAALRPLGVGPGKKVLPSTRKDGTERLLETSKRYVSLRADSPAASEATEAEHGHISLWLQADSTGWACILGSTFVFKGKSQRQPVREGRG